MSEDTNDLKPEVAGENNTGNENSKELELSNNIVDKESQDKKYPYPKSVFFIISNEFCERFNYYGMRTVLTLYLTNILLYDETDATVIYHAFTSFVYFFPVMGAIISDSWLGKFKTIFYMSIIYVIGSALVSITSIEPLHIPQREFTIIGLLLVAVGTGGIKPCVSAFGGDQFKLPQQAAQLVSFFSLFYFSINSGSLISTTLSPILRENVHCFDGDSCFPLAFGVPSLLMALSIVIFVFGKPLYKIKEPEGNILLKVVKCIFYALTNKSKKEKKVEHWLDRSEEKFGKKLVDDVKSTLRVLVLYIPLPIFWSLYDQQGSVWTLQATKMDGDLGFYTILPDQMQVVNPLLILAFIPLFTYGVYPLFAKFNLLKSPLQRMVAGGFLLAIAFVISAGVSTVIENGEPTLPSAGNIQLRLYNPSNCDYHIHSPTDESEVSFDMFNLNAMESSYTEMSVSGTQSLTIMFMSNSDDCETYTKTYDVTEENAYFAYISLNEEPELRLDIVNNTIDANPILRTLTYNGSLEVVYTDEDGQALLVVSDTELYNTTRAGSYYYNGQKFDLAESAVYTIFINDQGVAKLNTVTIIETINLLWQLPQYVVITAGEIMFAITGLEFSYSQAPIEMKSVLQSAWLFTTAIGNLIIIIVESSRIFDKVSYDLLLFAALMMLDMVLFGYLAYKYQYVEQIDSEVISLDEKKISSRNGGLDNPALTDTNET